MLLIQLVCGEFIPTTLCYNSTPLKMSSQAAINEHTSPAITSHLFSRRKPSNLNSDRFLLLTSYLLLLTSYFLPLTSYLLLLTSYFLPLTSYFLPLTSYLLLLTSYFLPLTSYLLLLT